MEISGESATFKSKHQALTAIQEPSFLIRRCQATQNSSLQQMIANYLGINSGLIRLAFLQSELQSWQQPQVNSSFGHFHLRKSLLMTAVSTGTLNNSPRLEILSCPESQRPRMQVNDQVPNTDIGEQPSASADLSEFVAWLRGVSLPGRLWTGGLGFSPQRHFHGAL